MKIKTNNFWLASSISFAAKSVNYRVNYITDRPIIKMLYTGETKNEDTKDLSNEEVLFAKCDKYIWKDLRNEIIEFNGIVTSDFNQENIRRESVQRIGTAIIRKLASKNADVGFYFPLLNSATEEGILYQKHYEKLALGLAKQLNVTAKELTTVDEDYKYFFSKNLVACFIDNCSEFTPLVNAQNIDKFCTFCDVNVHSERYTAIWPTLQLMSVKDEDPEIIIERYKRFQIRKQYNFDPIAYQKATFGGKNNE